MKKLLSFKKNNDYDLIINCDVNNKINKKFFFRRIKKNYKSVAYTTIINHKIFLNNKINLVSIASYDDHHFKQILLCLKRDINVIIEKPICLKFEELIKIKKALKKSKSKITSNMVLRVNDLFSKIKKKINPKSIYYIEGDYI